MLVTRKWRVGTPECGDRHVWLEKNKGFVSTSIGGHIPEGHETLGGGSWTRGEKPLTDCSVSKDDEKARVIYPLDLEATIRILPFCECRLNIPRFKLLGEACERENASDAG